MHVLVGIYIYIYFNVVIVFSSIFSAELLSSLLLQLLWSIKYAHDSRVLTLDEI